MFVSTYSKQVHYKIYLLSYFLMSLSYCSIAPLADTVLD